MLGSNLGRISLMVFLSRFFRGFIFIYMALYLVEVGFSGLQVGLLLSLMAITSIFITLPTGIINDRLDIRYSIAVGHLLVFIFLVIVGSIPNFWLFIPLFIVGGMGLNIIETSYNNYVFKDKEPWHEGRKYGIFMFTDYLSLFFGIIIGMSLVFLAGFPFTLVFSGFYYLVLIPFIFILRPITVAKTRLIQYEKDFLHPNNILLAIILFLHATHWGAESTSYALFLKTVLGLDSFGMGMYTSLSIIFLGLAGLVFGIRMDHRTDFHKLFVIGLVVSGITHILMTTPDVAVSFVMRAIHEVGDGIAHVSLLFWLGRKFKRSRIGGDAGIFLLFMTIGGALGALVYGPVGSLYGYATPLVVSGVTSVIAGGMFMAMKRRLD